MGGRKVSAPVNPGSVGRPGGLELGPLFAGAWRWPALPREPGFADPAGAAGRYGLPMARILLWAAAGVAVLVCGLALLLFFVAMAALVQVGSLDRFPWELWISLGGGMAVQVLLPHLAATALAWWLLARVRPTLDRRWPPVIAGLPLVAAITVVPLLAEGFPMWQPQTATDVLATAALIVAATSAALLLPRRLSARLAPGTLAT